MSEQQISVNRALVGVIAVACLVTGLAVGIVDDFTNLWCAAFIRVGLVMGAIWVALPSRDREAAWANLSPGRLIGVMVVAVMLVTRPRVFFPMLIGAGVLWFVLRPRKSSRERTQRRDSTH